MDNLIKFLNEKYPEVKFKQQNEGTRILLLFNDEDLIWDDEFNDTVVGLAEKFLTEDEFNRFSYIYDYLDEISSTEMKAADESMKVNFEVKTKSCELVKYDVVRVFKMGSHRVTIESKTKEQSHNIRFCGAII